MDFEKNIVLQFKEYHSRNKKSRAATIFKDAPETLAEQVNFNEILVEVQTTQDIVRKNGFIVAKLPETYSYFNSMVNGKRILQIPRLTFYERMW